MIGEPIVVVRAPTVEDRYGNDQRDWDEATEFSIIGAFDPGGRSEVNDGRSATVTQPTVYTEDLTEIFASDRLRIRGQVYEVDGEPAVWRGPYGGGRSGQVIQARRVDG